MNKAYIFGAGGTGQRVAGIVKDKFEILGFVDNDCTKWGSEIEGLAVYDPDILKTADFDFVLIGTLMGYEELKKQMGDMGIPAYKIREDYVGLSVNSRIFFLKRYAEIVYKEHIQGAVGEAGVFRGEFAKEINYYFPDRCCYLFDTFEGFTEEDIKYEEETSLVTADYMHNLSEEYVYNKMPNKDKIKIFKGWFPNTAFKADIKDRFCFVNLDMDLYKPIYEGLAYFYPKMNLGGVILIHDYFSDAYPNVKTAVEDYERRVNRKLAKIPIGDDISIAIIKD